MENITENITEYIPENETETITHKEYESFKKFKEELDETFNVQAASFVKSGYMLKRARDTDILKESGYKTLAEFAKAEYNFSKDTVSRYIRINDTFSKNGYSEELADRYKEFGRSKLEEMLTLPDYIVDEITASLSRDRIREIKKEISEEKKITDIEVLCEQNPVRAIECDTAFEKILYGIMKEQKENYNEIIAASEEYNWSRVYDLFAPGGSAVLTTRIPGEGKYIISFKEKNTSISTTNIRTGVKLAYTEGAVMNTITKLFGGISYEAAYPDEAEKKTDEKAKVAPAQPQPITENSKNNTENKEKDTEIIENHTEIKEITTQPEEFYPEPVQMNSICYSCIHNSECGRKTAICTECNEYINKAEAEKTEEQKYSEEQDRIDRETAKILQMRADEEKMKTLPGEADLRKIHEIKIAHEYYDDVAAGIKRFELRKNDRNYKVNDSLKMTEYKAGEPTGRVLNAVIVYMLEDYTGLEEGYCILGIEMEAQSEEK